MSLQQTLVLPLLPDFPHLLDTTADTASWLVTATLLAGAVATPTIARLADMFGKKRMMLVALAVMIAGSVLGALGTSIPLIIAARAMQGVGMSLIPVGIAIMRDELPRDRVPLGVALMSATLAIGAGIGLPASGLIAAHTSWHGIFVLTAVVGAIMLAAVAAVVPESPVRTHGSFDYRGAALLTVALTAGLLALSKGDHWGWTSAPTIGLATLAVVVLVAWIPVELRVPNPLVDVRVAARPAVLLVNLAALLTGMTLFLNMLVTTQLLQLPTETGFGLGLDTLHSGLWMAPGAIVFGVMAPVSAASIRRFGAQMTLLAGGALMAVAYGARVIWSHDLAQVVTGSMLVNVGTALTYAAMPTLIMRAVPVTESASANGLNTLMRSIGTSTSSALMAAVVSSSAVMIGGQVVPSFGALTAVMALAAAASVGVVALAVPTFRMRDVGEDGEQAHRHDTVVRGEVTDRGGRGIRHAVVTVLTPSGEAVDWSQVDPTGRFTVAVPGEGQYLVVAAADGWTPASRLTRLCEEEPAIIVLHERLVLSGTVSDRTGPAAGAVMALTRTSGEAVMSATTDDAGAYEVPLPPNGRYVLSVVHGGRTAARPVTVWGASRTADVEIGTDAAVAGDPT
ncbi:UNVERIFIED_CONTAM: hypothetical protein LK11_13685 [Mumia flava]